MSEHSVEVLNTKLDILIDDFQSFKKQVMAFIIAIVVPFSVFIALTVTENSKDIALGKQETAQLLKKANGHRYYIKNDIIKELKE